MVRGPQEAPCSQKYTPVILFDYCPFPVLMFVHLKLNMMVVFTSFSWVHFFAMYDIMPLLFTDKGSSSVPNS